MITIAVCDDDKIELKTTSKLLNEFLKEHPESEVNVRYFLNSIDMLSAIEKHNFDIYLLDIIMGEVNGIDIGKAIRNNDKNAYIVYTTRENSFALRSFCTQPFNYLVKPLNKTTFNATLSQLFEKIKDVDQKKFFIKTKDGVLTILFSQILYIEYIKPCMKFLLSNNDIVYSLSSKLSFSELIKPLLEDERFVRPHTSFLCNMQYVEKFSAKQFSLKNNAIVPVSKNIYADVKKTYFNYLFSKN